MTRFWAIVAGAVITASCSAGNMAPTAMVRVQTIPATATEAPAMTSPDLVTDTKLPAGPVAPEVASDTWLNSPPLAWNSLRGSVVLVEFWTFDCVNCRDVIPALSGMYDSYKDKGFTLIGVHSPEFQYEHVLTNVRDAVRKLGVRYPVAIDNDYANWNRYRNLYWPALYLVDKRGVIRYTHIGEGGYTATRAWIEKLLGEP